VNERFEQWLEQKTAPASEIHPSSFILHPLTAEQLSWLRAIRDHIATSLSIELDDLDYTPFNQEGGLGKAHQLFGDQLPKLLEELNEALAA
jgi:type I restriction enzyme R subunit